VSSAPFPPPQPPPLILTPKDEEILQAFATYRFLTAQEITHLYYSGWVGKKLKANGSFPIGSLTYARSRLAALSGNQDITDKDLAYGYPLWRAGFPTGKRGANEKILALSLTGRRMLERLGIPVSWHLRPEQLRTFSHSYLLHDLSRNRFVVALLTWAKSKPNLSIASHLSHELSRHPTVVEIPEQGAKLVGGKPVKVTVIPDGLVLVTDTRTGGRIALLLEIDQNTQTLPRFRKHIAARLAYVRSSHFRATYGNIPYRIVYATQGVTESASRARLASMCQFTMRLLIDRQCQDDSRRFRFTTINYTSLYQDAQSLFEQAVWFTPDDLKLQSPLPLLTG
jgi:hypothetical protein